jgi:hypothetical protein
MIRTAAALSFVVGSLGCSALQTDCQPIGCYDSVTVDFQRADEKRFATGDYMVEVVADSRKITASCAVPAGSSSQVTCYSDATTQVVSDAAHLYVILMFKPQMVSAKLALSGMQLAETTFAPVYGRRDECDTCFHAKEPVTVKQ